MSNVLTQAFSGVILKCRRASSLFPTFSTFDSQFCCTSRSTLTTQLQWVGTKSSRLNQPQCRAFIPVDIRASLHTTSCLAAVQGPSRRGNKYVQQGSKTKPRLILDVNTVRAAFNNDVDFEAGAKALKILQTRRAEGSLIEHGVHIADSTIPEEDLRRGLQWLRQRIPVDEEYAAQKWADKAATVLEEDFDKRAQELGLFKSTSDDTEAAQQDVYSRPGNRSMLDDMRIHNENKAKEAEEQREQSGEAQRSRDMQLAKSSQAEQQAKDRAIALAEHRKKQTEEGMLFTGEIPDMTATRRLLPSTLFALFAIASIVYLAETYVPPEPARRLWRDIPPTVATLTAMGLGMSFITCAWHAPKFWKLMNTYLLAVPALPHPVSMLGNIFSHQNFKHLIANTCFLWLYGLSLHEDIGRANFLAIFCVGGVTGSLTSLYYHVLKGNIGATMSGSSGAVAAIIIAWVSLNITNADGPLVASSKFLEMAKFCGYTFVLSQIPLHFLPGVGQRIDVMAHAGGAFAGLAGAIVLKTRLEWKKKFETSKRNTIIKTPS